MFIEEIFAESYDDDNKIQPNNNEVKDVANSDARYIVYEVANCPNLSNPYHKCVEYCLEKFEKKKFNPDSLMIQKRNVMLKKYPLPPNWIEVADPCTNRFYYWNTKKDEVSWLSPSHPRSVVRLPKDRIKSPTKSSERVKDRRERDYTRERRQRRHSSSESSSSHRSRSSDSGDDRRSSRHRSRKDKRKEEKKSNLLNYLIQIIFAVGFYTFLSISYSNIHVEHDLAFALIW